ncbi:60S ribosomal protein L27-A [Serendipita indica DSM 11827]|nr:60S ribosomal protein L27-A [Serendipita indica DSM 11827]
MFCLYTGGTFASGSETATQPTDTSAQLAQLTDSASPHSDGSTIRIAAIVGGVLGLMLLVALATFARWWFKEGRHPPPARLNHVRDALCSRDEQARTYRGADAIAIPWTPEPALSTPLLPPPSVATDSKLPIAQMYSSQRFQEVSGGLGSSSSSLEPTSSGVTGSLVSEPVAIVLQGRQAGRKVVVIKQLDEGTKDRPYPHAIVAGIERYPRKVTKRMGKKTVAKRNKVKPFLKTVNCTHLFPTRYALELEGLKGCASADTFKEPSQREDAKKTIKKLFEERYVSGKNKWFFQPLRF